MAWPSSLKSVAFTRISNELRVLHRISAFSFKSLICTVGLSRNRHVLMHKFFLFLLVLVGLQTKEKNLWE